MEINQMISRVYEEVMNRSVLDRKEKAIVIGTVSDAYLKTLNKQYEWSHFTADVNYEHIDVIVITHISNAMLARLANGISQTEEESFILQMLLENQKVVTSKDCIDFFQYKKIAPPSLYKLYETHYERIISFGLQVDAECNDDKSKKNTPTTTVTSLHFEPLNKKVITENDLQKLFLKKIINISIPSTSIFTPLANDYIRKNNLKISHLKGE